MLGLKDVQVIKASLNRPNIQVASNDRAKVQGHSHFSMLLRRLHPLDALADLSSLVFASRLLAVPSGVQGSGG